MINAAFPTGSRVAEVQFVAPAEKVHKRTGVWDSVERFENATYKELQGLIPHSLLNPDPVVSRNEVIKLWEIDGAY